MYYVIIKIYIKKNVTILACREFRMKRPTFCTRSKHDNSNFFKVDFQSFDLSNTEKPTFSRYLQ